MFFGTRFFAGLFIGAVAGALLVVFVVPQTHMSGFVNRTSGPLVGREEGVTRSAQEGKLRYTHPKHHFSLEFPQELAIGRFTEGLDSETVVFQKPGEESSFQIFVTPYKQTEITEERLQKDLQGSTFEEPVEVMIGAREDVRAVIFFSEHPTLGRLREVWFIHDGFLYEVAARAELDLWLAEILKTWTFEDQT